MIKRESYLRRLREYAGKPLVKVLTGVRRCGKSTLLEDFARALVADGAKPSQVVAVNFEDLRHEPLKNYRALHDYIVAKMRSPKLRYSIFLDEIQLVPAYEKAVDSLQLRKNADIYLTGSNAYFLSGELATLLSGRYIEIPVFPLSLAEFRQANPNLPPSDLYTKYLSQGSLPYLTQFAHTPRQIRDYYGGVCNTVLIKDVIVRKKISDPHLLERVAQFLAQNIGSLNSVKSICDALNAGGRSISVNTTESYISGLTDALLFHKVGRYDIKGKELLKTGHKHYLCDPGFRNYLLDNERTDFGALLENIVYLELARRGYKIAVGRIGVREVDFAAVSPSGGLEYFQVALTLRPPGVFEREVAALEAIRDSHPKTVLHLDDDPATRHNGIRLLNALDWLLGKDESLANARKDGLNLLNKGVHLGDKTRVRKERYDR